jgi:hypothetical protein
MRQRVNITIDIPRSGETWRVSYQRRWKRGCHIERVTLRAHTKYQRNTLIRFVHLVGAGCP